MSPFLMAGDYVLSIRSRYLPYHAGCVVVVRHPVYGIIIKRVAEYCALRGIWLTGDNPLSTDSDRMGWVAFRYIIGRVVFSVKQKQARDQPL